MSSIATKSRTNRAIQELRRQWKQCDLSNRPSQLWVMCADSSMDRVANYVRDSEPSLLLRTQSASFTPIESISDIDDAIEFALTELGLSKVILCGHSCCNNGSSSESNTLVNGDDILSRVRQGQKRSQNARIQLVNQFHRLQASPTISRLLQQGTVTIDGLFYIEETGIFSRYNATAQQFDALIDGIVTG